jgi:hypothetical protein
MRLAALCGIIILGGCGEAPQQTAVEKEPYTDETSEGLKAAEKRIEEAADAAAKLVEQEANSEIDQQEVAK